MKFYTQILALLLLLLVNASAGDDCVKHNVGLFPNLKLKFPDEQLLKKKYEASIDGCKSWCDETPACFAVAMRSGECYLYSPGNTSTTISLGYRKDWYGGLKSCWDDTTEWKNVQPDVYINYDLEKYPLSITTDSANTSSDEVYIQLSPVTGSYAAYLHWSFSDYNYSIYPCTALTNSSNALSMTNVSDTAYKVWILTKTSTALSLTCNGVEVVKLVYGSVNQTQYPDCVEQLSKKTDVVRFSGTAADIYLMPAGADASKDDDKDKDKDDDKDKDSGSGKDSVSVVMVLLSVLSAVRAFL